MPEMGEMDCGDFLVKSERTAIPPDAREVVKISTLPLCTAETFLFPWVHCGGKCCAIRYPQMSLQIVFT